MRVQLYDHETRTLTVLPEYPPEVARPPRRGAREPRLAPLAPAPRWTPPDARPTNTRVVYTDGTDGGWGVVITSQGGDADAPSHHIRDLWGPVVVQPASPPFIGATMITSPGAELTALVEACRWLLEEDDDPGAPVMFRPSTAYAANTTACVWPRAGTERAIIDRVRASINDLATAGRQMSMARLERATHPWMQRATQIAAIGASGWASGAPQSGCTVWHGWREPSAVTAAGPAREGMPHRPGCHECFLCFDEFADADRPGIDSSLPTPATTSRAVPGMWQCAHASCRGCEADCRRCDRCPVCRAPRTV